MYLRKWLWNFLLIGLFITFGIFANATSDNLLLDPPSLTQKQLEKEKAYAQHKVDVLLKDINTQIDSKSLVYKYAKREFINRFVTIIKAHKFNNFAICGRDYGKQYYIIIILDFPKINHKIILDGFYNLTEVIKI